MRSVRVWLLRRDGASSGDLVPLRVSSLGPSTTISAVKSALSICAAAGSPPPLAQHIFLNGAELPGESCLADAGVDRQPELLLVCYDDAVALARATDRPLLVLFDEVPG